MIFGFFRKRKEKVAQKEEEEKIGEITHYFPKPEAGVIQLSSSLTVGDTIHIKGQTTDFKQKVDSMQIDGNPIEKAAKGKLVGVKVKERVRVGDEVYRLA